MAVITLTDRISVRVTAKDSTETSNQNKTNGNNVAKSLTGDSGTSLTDSAAEEVGAALGDTVTGEDGKQYAKIHGVVNAIKAASNSGELQSAESHQGKIFNGTLYNLGGAPTKLYDGQIIPCISSSANVTCSLLVETANDVYMALVDTGQSYPSIIIFSVDNSNTPSIKYGYAYDGASIDSYPNNYFQYYRYSRSIIVDSVNHVSRVETNSGTSFYPNIGYVTFIPALSSYVGFGDAIGNHILGWYLGPVTGSPKVDTTKTDNEIASEVETAARQTGNIQQIGTDTYVAVTDSNGNPMYFLGT